MPTRADILATILALLALGACGYILLCHTSAHAYPLVLRGISTPTARPTWTSGFACTPPAFFTPGASNTPCMKGPCP